jgi:hypothetical protein
MCRCLFGLTALAPAQVWSRSYVQGSGALTTRGPSWSGDGVAMAAYDEPTASGVTLLDGVATPAVVPILYYFLRIFYQFNYFLRILYQFN